MELRQIVRHCIEVRLYDQVIPAWLENILARLEYLLLESGLQRNPRCGPYRPHWNLLSLLVEEDQEMTLREKLDIIDGWLLEPEGENLAHVLSTFRGPDNGNVLVDLKNTTTNPIRRVAFPRAFERSFAGRASTWFTMDTKDYKQPEGDDHFSHHIRLAAQTLGLRSR